MDFPRLTGKLSLSMASHDLVREPEFTNRIHKKKFDYSSCCCTRISCNKSLSVRAIPYCWNFNDPDKCKKNWR